MDVPEDYVSNSGRLRACVEWIVEHEGECLSDHPRQLAMFKRALADQNALIAAANMGCGTLNA